MRFDGNGVTDLYVAKESLSSTLIPSRGSSFISSLDCKIFLSEKWVQLNSTVSYVFLLISLYF